MDPNSERNHFDSLFIDLLSETNSSEKLLMLSFIRRCLHRFGLTNDITEEEIISEVYKRGVDSLRSGRQLLNAKAWLRTTAFNIIRERARRQKGTKSSSDVFDGNLNQLCASSQTQWNTFDDLHNLKQLRGIFQPVWNTFEVQNLRVDRRVHHFACGVQALVECLRWRDRQATILRLQDPPGIQQFLQWRHSSWILSRKDSGIRQFIAKLLRQLQQQKENSPEFSYSIFKPPSHRTHLGQALQVVPALCAVCI